MLKGCPKSWIKCTCLTNRPGRWGGVIQLPNENNVTAAVTPLSLHKKCSAKSLFGTTGDQYYYWSRAWLKAKPNGPVIIHFIWSCLILQQGYKENKEKKQNSNSITPPPPPSISIPILHL